MKIRGLTMNEVDISVIVPLFNESSTLVELCELLTKNLRALNRSYEIIFVNDGSTDSTRSLVGDIAQRDSKVICIDFTKNFGQTAAISAGFDNANGEILISMDGDLQHDPNEIHKFVEKIDEGYDLVSGWRKERADGFFLRRFPSWCANKLIKLVSGVNLHDFGTTFKAYRRETLEGVELYGDSHRFIPALISYYYKNFYEIPISNIVRPAGKSCYGIGRTLRVFLDILFIRFFLGYIGRPFHFFGIIALILGLLGTSVCFILTIGHYFYGSAIGDNLGNLLFGIMLVILSVQFFGIGIVAEINSRVYFKTSDKRNYKIRAIHSSDRH